MRAAAAVAALVAVAALAALATGGSADRGLRVYAASSLREALLALDGDARLSFAGSNRLQLQIERGAPADVFLAASPDEPAALHAAGRCERPRPFATNRLALLAPAGRRTAVRTVGDLDRAGIRLAIGAAGVPVGRYARAALQRLGLARILDRARVSEEPSAAGVVAKVALGSADAGIAYLTDARAAGTRVRAVALPAHAQPVVGYHACAVVGAGADRSAAEAYLDRLTGPAGRAALAGAGFGSPPAP